MFLWKDGSEVPGTFWNELDFEKVGADCRILTNAFYGNPAVVHNQSHAVEFDPCSDFHTYAYEWTPESIVWYVDDVEIRRETGAGAMAFTENAADGMQIRFNVWPGDASFGGNFTPAILPVHQYVDWVEFSSYADGEYTFEWREEFEEDSLPPGWLRGNWASPKDLSIHDPGNVYIVDGYAVLSLTADDAVGPSPEGTGSAGPPSGESDAGCSMASSRALEPNAWLAVLGLVTIGALRRRKAP
jgi:MYXO-CTERM domain-containing protein